MKVRIEDAQAKEARLTLMSRLFSPGVIQEMACQGHSPQFARIVRNTFSRAELNQFCYVSNLLDGAYAQLQKEGSRTEYVYKSSLFEKMLIGRHSLRTATMLTEFRVDKSKADVVMLNGTSTAYEIKSERDTLARMKKQLSSYSQVFEHSYVVCSHLNVQSVLMDCPPLTGVLVLTKRGSFQTVRPASPSDRLSAKMMYNSIRILEAKEILSYYGVDVPRVPNTAAYETYRELFESLGPEKAHAGMVRVLKRRRSLEPLRSYCESLPASVRALALSVNLNEAARQRLETVINCPLQEALQW